LLKYRLDITTLPRILPYLEYVYKTCQAPHSDAPKSQRIPYLEEIH